MNKVTNLHADRIEALSLHFDEVMQDAVEICLVSVKRDGSVDMLMADDVRHEAALIGALECAKHELLRRGDV